MEDSLRLEAAERQLALIQSFHPRIDTKVSAIFAISSVQIAVATLNVSISDLSKWWVAIPAGVFVCLAIGIHWMLYQCTYPHLTGGTKSLTYFGEIAKRTEYDFVKEYLSLSASDLYHDLAKQIWRNSEIVSAKYRSLKHATILLIASLAPWALLLLALSVSYGRVPLINH